ncbi:MAG: MOSC domain-containing protein [Leucobacter sp.]
MPRIVALYRYPVKGFTPEPRESLIVQSDGRVAGDRVLAFRFANAATPEEQDGLDYWPKAKGLALQNFPALAALRLSFDEHAQRVRITHGAELLIESGLDSDGRKSLIEAITEFVLASDQGPRLRKPGLLPLVLLGDGERARFQDRARGFVTVHSRASVEAVSTELGFGIDDRRFRSNVVIDGLPAWDELRWSNTVRMGNVRFTTEGPIVRCTATHANPDTGARDAKVLPTLTTQLGQEEPTLGRLLIPAGSGDECGGVIRVGDEVTVE